MLKNKIIVFIVLAIMANTVSLFSINKASSKAMIVAAAASSSSEKAITKKGTDANLYGHVVNENGEHLPYATILLKGTTIGTKTDNSGHFQIINLPTGKFTVIARSIGFKPYEEEIEFVDGESVELKITLVTSAAYAEEIVVTADRYATERKKASLIVNTISPEKLQTTQCVVLSDGLNFSPGLRMENNCQNCGFSQVRMNGMEGSYSQILINSRSIFSGLAGVYGLELIPVNMIDQIEVVRGGGSALYGSNAIAGTINLILKDPVSNYFEAGASSGFIGLGVDGSGSPAMDNNITANTTVVSPDKKMGIALYGYYRDREVFDANDDNYSELSMINNTTFGSRLFYRPTHKSKIAIDFFNINESRNGGGSDFDLPKHEMDISEALEHKITTGAITYTQLLRDHDQWEVYVSGQNVNRESYYGSNKSLQDYGNTQGLTYSIGSTYNLDLGLSKIIGGFEITGDDLLDTKKAYPVFNQETGEVTHTKNTTITDQEKIIYGVFAQYEINWDKFKGTAGVRYDHYEIAHRDPRNTEYEKQIGDVISPRITLLYDIFSDFQARVSYSTGYRAPQVFDEDLHIETSGLHKVIHENDPNLKQETSQSVMGSLDYNGDIGNMYVGFLVEGFYTMLIDPFVTEYVPSEDENIMVCYRSNSEDGAKVAGLNTELRLAPIQSLELSGGFTYQISRYDIAQDDFNEKAFYRTPDNYGFITVDWDLTEMFGISVSGNYTGSMLVPYFGIEDRGIADYDPENGALIESDSFFDMGFKLSYDFYLGTNIFQIYGGMKNILNSYQNDFDSGISRDPGYIYGPGQPRTAYLGFSIKS